MAGTPGKLDWIRAARTAAVQVCSTHRDAVDTIYTEWANQAPAQALLYVDNAAYPMTYVSGSYISGAIFQVSTTLPAGNHAYSFVFTDSYSGWADPFGPPTYAGPNVGANATSKGVGTIIDPGQNVTPDMDNEYIDY